MKTVETSVISRRSALATARRQVRARVKFLRLLRTSLPHLMLAGVLAFCLLPASTNKVWAQLCRCAEPGWMNCSLLGHYSHEPATSAFPQCLARTRRAAPRPRQQREPGSAQVAPPGGGGGGAPQGFQPQIQDQIKPLNCPLSLRGLIRIAPTFYGGTRCAYSTPSLAAGIQLPWEPPPLPQAQAVPSQPATSPLIGGGVGGGVPNPQSQPAGATTVAALNKNRANNNLLDLLSAGTGLSKTKLTVFAAVAVGFMAVGFFGSAILPLFLAWP